MTEHQFKEVTDWQAQTFKQATALSKIEHLKEELAELIHDIQASAPGKRLEWADCFILLFGAAKADGLSYHDICAAVDAKMNINRNRTWGQPKENGVVNHVREDEPKIRQCKRCGYATGPELDEGCCFARFPDCAWYVAKNENENGNS